VDWTTLHVVEKFLYQPDGGRSRGARRLTRGCGYIETW
jgi:hypothetical protein